MSRLTLPNHPEAETSVLGAILLRENDALAQVDLEPDAFFDPKHRAIFEAMRVIADRGGKVEILGVEAELARREVLRSVGGLEYLSKLLHEAFTDANIAHYAALVAEAARKRAVISGLSDALELARKGSDADEVLEAAYANLNRVGLGQRDNARSIGEWTKVALQRLNDATAATSAGGLVGIPTGLRDVDAQLGGLRRGIVTLLGARPSAGKSAIARVIAGGAHRAGVGGHVFQMEDTGDVYAMRELSDRSHVNLHALNTGRVNSADVSAVLTHAEDLHRAGGWIVDDSAALSSAQIAMRVRKHKRANRTGLVVVDYVQLMSEPSVKSPREMDRLTFAIRGLARIAREEDVAMLVLSQLSRKLEDRPDKRPNLADLRESGELEQVARVVLFPFRPEVYAKTPAEKAALRGQASLIVAKNTHGKAHFEIPLYWDGATATYRDAVEEEAPADDAPPHDDTEHYGSGNRGRWPA